MMYQENLYWGIYQGEGGEGCIINEIVLYSRTQTVRKRLSYVLLLPFVAVTF